MNVEKAGVEIGTRTWPSVETEKTSKAPRRRSTTCFASMSDECLAQAKITHASLHFVLAFLILISDLDFKGSSSNFEVGTSSFDS